jgi:3-methyladenine DNA glycosylase AlkC
MSQMFFRKIIKKHPAIAKKILLNLVNSSYSNIRRFVSETLRPVKENKWFHDRPEYPLSILRNLFKESAAYPRTSVGNNLSDLAKRNPELVYKLVKELVDSGNENSYWIAYRACRSLVKKEPDKVMKLLKVDEYKYKNRPD